MGNTIVYVIVKVETPSGPDVDEIISACKYSFQHPLILRTEIVGVTDKMPLA